MELKADTITRRLPAALILLACCCLSAASCDDADGTAARRQQQAAAAASQPDAPDAARRRVLLVSIDGLRPDVLLRADTPNARGLMASGSFTFWARTVPECYTLPAHVSMLTGVSPQKHGVEWNDHIEEAYPLVPTLFKLAKQAGLSTAMTTGKTKFIALAEPGTLDWSYLPRDEPITDAFVAARAVEIIRAHRPHVLFVHLAGPDNVGHAAGWGTPEQLAAVREADEALGVVLGAVREAGVADSTLVILTSDHGGDGREHGPDDPRSRHVPWIASGPGVAQDSDLTRFPGLSVDVVDTFPTACRHLGLTAPGAVEGKVVEPIWMDAASELLRDAGPVGEGG